jgi:hypothetical protein
MNKQEAETWLDVCISNEELSLNNFIKDVKASTTLSQEDKIRELKESYFRIDSLKELREYVRRYLR